MFNWVHQHQPAENRVQSLLISERLFGGRCPGKEEGGDEIWWYPGFLSHPFSKREESVRPLSCFIFKAHFNLRGFSFPSLELGCVFRREVLVLPEQLKLASGRFQGKTVAWQVLAVCWGKSDPWDNSDPLVL